MRQSVTFSINGVETKVSGDALFQPVSSFLRYQSRLTGTKVVCAEGDCGACTVMLAKWNPDAQKIQYQSVNSCIAMTFAMDGASLVTVEGLASEKGLCEIQDSMVRNFGAQCGFCTPGFVMAIAGLHEHATDITEQKVKNYLTGNLCRCTGYSPIVQAALDVDRKKHISLQTQYPPTPRNFAAMAEPIHVMGSEIEFFAPVTLAEACAFKAKGDVVIFSGGTDLGVIFNKGHLRPKRILSLHLLHEQYQSSYHGGKIKIGAGVTLRQLQDLTEESVPALARFLNIFASPQIKNSATVVGNLANASPIADVTPPLMALDAQLEIAGTNGRRLVPLAQFYLGYKKMDLALDEIITAVIFDVPAKESYFENYKVSQRRDLDISTVNASFRLQVDGGKITLARVVLGGVAATTVRLMEIEKQLLGQPLDQSTLRRTQSALLTSIQPISDVRGSAEYRSLVSANLFQKFAQACLTL